MVAYTGEMGGLCLQTTIWQWMVECMLKLVPPFQQKTCICLLGKRVHDAIVSQSMYAMSNAQDAWCFFFARLGIEQTAPSAFRLFRVTMGVMFAERGNMREVKSDTVRCGCMQRG